MFSALLTSLLFASSEQNAEIEQLQKDVEMLKVENQKMKDDFEGNSKSGLE